MELPVANLTTIYFSRDKLACSACLPADVVLCVDPSKVAPHQCSDNTDQPFEFSFVEATLTAVVKDGCYFRYTFEYNETLVEGGDPLSNSDISGVFCKGCLVSYMEEIVGNEPTVEIVEGVGVKFTSPHGCEFTFATGCEGVCNTTTVTDTSTIDMSISGIPPAPYVISGAVKISADAGNTISAHADGIYSSNNILTVTDTATVNLTITGAAPQALSADVKLSTATVNNQTVAVGDGLHTPPSWSFGGSVRFVLAAANTLVYNQATTISANTADGADNSSLSLTGGGLATLTRGAQLQLAGNEEATNPGRAFLSAGDVVGGQVGIRAPNNTGYVYVETGGSEKWRFSGVGTALLQSKVSAGYITNSTVDGADNAEIGLGGGGAIGGLRGATLYAYGNEHATLAGKVIFEAGNVAGGSIRLNTGANLTRWEVDENGVLFYYAPGNASIIAANTTDGVDTSNLYIAGGGSNLVSRGAYLRICGNEAATSEGDLEFHTGNIAAAEIRIHAATLAGGTSPLVATINHSGTIYTGTAVADVDTEGLNITATGTVIGDAKILVDKINTIGFGSAATGIKPSNAWVDGQMIFIVNLVANDIKLYPESAIVNLVVNGVALAVGASTNLATLKSYMMFRNGGGQWIVTTLN